MISTIVQTVVITITLIIFILQFRSQEKSIREASYQGLMGRYNDFIRGMVDSPALARLLLEHPTDVSADEATVYAHLLVAYGIIEEAYLLYIKKWITKDEWNQWSAWLVSLARREELREIHDRTVGTFDPNFEDYVSRILKETESAEKKESKQ